MAAPDHRNAVAKIYAKAWSDPDYAARLKSDPHSVLEAEGLNAPKHLRIHVHEDSDSEAHFVIPQRPSDVTDEQLSAASPSHSDICSAPDLHADICSA